MSKPNKILKEDIDIENFGSSYDLESRFKSLNSSAAPQNSNFTSTPSSSTLITPEQIEVSRRWLTRPYQQGDPPLLCYVERDRSGFNMMSPVYKLYIEGNGSIEGRFVMSAKKKVSNRTSYYIVSLDPDPTLDDRGASTILGKIRGNQIGSQYIFTDHGLSAEKAKVPSMLRKELGLVRFAFDSGGPSKIDVWIPAVNSTGSSCAVWQPTDENGTIESNVDRALKNGPNSNESFSRSGFPKLTYLFNKKPKWDSSHGGHVLNFQGRVTESSVKNFQLCSMETGDEVVLQFGRVGKNKFNMDVSYPLSPFQAFAVCVACMDGKLADRQGFELIRRITGNSQNSYNAKENEVDSKKSIKEESSSGKNIFQKISKNFF